MTHFFGGPTTPLSPIAMLQKKAPLLFCTLRNAQEECGGKGLNRAHTYGSV